MTTRLIPGPFKWELTRDNRGHREYKLTFRVESNDPLDGPNTVLATPGFPIPGSFWVIGHDVDLWAWCRWGPTSVKLVDDSDPAGCLEWLCELTFSTAPDEYYCRLIQQEDPLLEPTKISGGTVKYNEEATFDRFGVPIVTSSHEQIRGPQVEFDRNRGTVHIEMNVPLLKKNFVDGFVDCVNSTPLWGNPARCVKLSKFSWDKKFYGPCTPYYTWKFDFDTNVTIDPATNQRLGFDRLILDEGTKVLNGHWNPSTGKWFIDTIGGSPPDPMNPQHFVRFKDRNGENARVILNGFGLPADVNIGTGTGSGESGGPAGYIFVQKYPGVDFTLLGIPTTL